MKIIDLRPIRRWRTRCSDAVRTGQDRSGRDCGSRGGWCTLRRGPARHRLAEPAAACDRPPDWSTWFEGHASTHLKIAIDDEFFA
jgi:hypothetical protein